MTQSKKSGNFMVVGKTGEGKTESMAQMVRIFMAQSDVSQIKDQYDNEDGKKRIQAIFDNCSTRITLNPGGNRE
ncbi:hypothetical protein [Pseudocitrobacter faecalis]